jgi:phage terminase small subunit
VTPRQEAFAAEFLIDLNATKAAVRAGYSAHSAAEQAHELMKQPDIASAIERGMAQRALRTQLAQDIVIDELAHLAFSRITHYTVDEDTGNLVLRDTAPLGAMAAVAAVKHRKRVRIEQDGAVVTTFDTEIRLWDKPRALLLLGRHVGLFRDRIELTGPNGGPIETVSRVERVILPMLPPSSLLNAPTHSGVIPAQDDSERER